MTRDLLLQLNGDRRGKFFQWLSEFEGEPRIAWYPSAGSDYRDLFYLHPVYSSYNPASESDVPPPDLFIHTDYHPWSSEPSFDNHILFRDKRTIVTRTYIEELPRLDMAVPLDREVVDRTKSSVLGRVVYLEAEVVSNEFGTLTARMVYACVENAAFCAERVIPLKATLNQIVQVRYGCGFGGSRSSGAWLLNILKRVGCECFITDGHHQRSSGDERIYELYPRLAGNEDTSILHPIRTIWGTLWSNHGDVSWNIVK